MRLRLPAFALAGVALLAAACSGGDDAPAGAAGPPGAVPTATPYASIPEPLLVSASDPSAAAEVYVVQPGDTLAAIARRFGTTAEAIEEFNDLAGPSIFIGQELRIPVGGSSSGGGSSGDDPPSDGETYVVQSGDTGFAIAIRFGITVEALAAANGMTVEGLNGLEVGQELVIPAP